jgi:hypothetical protein
MIEEEDRASPRCGCTRPLRKDEKLCPYCRRLAATRWKVPLKLVVMPVLALVGAAVFGGRIKPRA